MISLNKEDLDWCVKRLPKQIVKLMKENPKTLSVGGGYIRSCITGDKLCDIDLFVQSEKQGKAIAKALYKGENKPFKTKNAYTIFRDSACNIQIITRWTYDKPEDVLYDLDFSICCAVIWYDNIDKKFVGACDNNYYLDLAAKRLRYNTPSRNEDAGGSVLRVLKYYGKGYRITLDSYAKVIARLMSGVDWDKSASLRSPELGGNGAYESNLAHVLKGLLLEVDPNSVEESQAVLGAATAEDQEIEEGDYIEEAQC